MQDAELEEELLRLGSNVKLHTHVHLPTLGLQELDVGEDRC